MEVWKDIEGFEGRYQISNLGNVMSLNYMAKGYAALLTPKINNKGYAWVDLWRNNKSHPLQVHRLVAQAFLNNPDNLPFVNHKDENPLNNNVSNLEWCTPQYNAQYSINLHPERSKWREGRKHRGFGAYKHTKKVRQIDISSGEVVCVYSYLAEAGRTLNKNVFSIRECCLGKRKTAYGYRWEFCE